MKSIPVAVALALCALAFPLFAQEEDAEGCSDPQLLSRLSGCYIYSCESNDFDEAIFQTGGLDDHGDTPVKTVEGRKTVVTYTCPGRISTLQVIRNAEAALKKAGFASLYSGPGSASSRAATLRKGRTWVQITASDVAGDITEYNVQVGDEQQMEQEMVADAAMFADEIGRTGRVAVYGIEFDTGKSTIRAEGEPVLREIVSLLNADPSLRLQIVGHTDDVGSAAANQALSEQRAKAVVQWLVANGISASRLTSAGAGASKPVADNTTAEGRAKNRRVELVKQ